MSTGWIKLHRAIRNHWLYEEERTFSRYEAWLDLLMMANHKDAKVKLGLEIIHVPEGSLITSELKLMDRWKWGKAKTRNFLKLLENDEMIIKKSDRKKTTITICNYSVYQEKETKVRPQADHEQTDHRPIADTNKNVKNLRNKELKEEEEKSPVGNDSPFQQIEDKYLSRRGGGLMITPNDAQAIERIIQEHIPLEDILVWIDEIFDQYRPRHRADGIKSFTYLEKGILDRWHAKNNQPSNVSEFKPKKQQDNLSALAQYAKEKGIKFGGG
ncbi:hypothetical protein FO510_05800 [Bacillus pumilus]|uniref:hypothetical protein n=1 Tax=Bacillus pumilus TaxID=1408 RepID=UPI00017A5E6D|nr:hypothetical protein [Bacillus pumilus]EDW22107.1 phage protein [Bacillus pumilus ATCC 7061]MBB6600750.1 hypothetical protein [Bacillus pumilus]MCR4352117.1 hypothetical protein [Bacillus pumilus]MCY7506347.1 hypothetical protein [Bacillus pumilus]MDR4269165.1 hypothetical protein [Bacillus pumilus]